ncbi:AAA domain-containing protein [Cohnella faecalis]|uniref:DUF2726 domain-containing protein n=1 Tax=Cohnella faecalis TaxID=2315694 RepID=A0A398CLZ0_9BACL|nr:AAA domain-containing protein [Cohnella faecalis]RIE00661.1 DUF2726 domain-containing protein [Cohnella faecalis]
MDERTVLIVTDKGDQTKDIAKYTVLENGVEIQFKSRLEPYTYSTSKVSIKRNPIPIDIRDHRVLYRGMPLRNVQEMVDFEGVIKVFFGDKHTQIYDSALIRLEHADGDNNKIGELMEYWAEIAQHVKTDDEPETFLKKQYSKLNAIHPESVLAAYMNQTLSTQSNRSSIPAIFPFRFNLSQMQALEQALLSKISIIEGPPGTGKTQTILNILANAAIMQNKSVAVVSGNNAAVQNVKDKLQKYGYDFIAASLGKKENKQAFFRNLPEYRVTEWKSEIQVEQLTETVRDLSERLKRLLGLANRKAKLDQDIAAYRLEQKHFHIHNRSQDLDGIKRLFLRRQTPDTIIAFLADEYFTGNRSLRFFHKANLLFKYGFFDFKKLKESRLEWITKLQMKYYESKLAELEQESSDIQMELDRYSFSDLLDRHESYSSALFKHKLHHKYEGKTTYQGSMGSYIRDFDEFIESFPIMLSTTHSLRSCIPEDFLFDYVIIDEASQVDLLTGVLALSCCKQVIVVGDTKQLPQIVDEKIQSKLVNRPSNETYNYFKHSLLSSMLAIYGENVPRVMLKEHYRCHPTIIGFCNSQYYKGDLIPFTPEKEADIPIRLHYTAIGNHMRRVTVKGKEGKFNHREIDAIKEEILEELRLVDVPMEHIGFTTPYRLQVEEASLILDHKIEIDTVHRYQGREKPIMILSTVLDRTRNGQIGKKFVENSCLVNVAVSRAQNQFILVTDHALFRNSRKDIGNLIRYIEYNSLHEHITSSELISVFDLLYSEYSAKLNQLQSRLVSKSRYKSENIMWRVLTDLLSEEKYKSVFFGTQVYLKDLFNNEIRFRESLNEQEESYIRNRASFDFVIYDAINKQPLLAIEVDGFASHRNNPDQPKRDLMKDSICTKYHLPLLRLPTTGSDEITKIRNALEQVL